MWHFWYPTRMLHLFCPVSSPFVKSYFGREFSWFLQQSFKLEMKNLFFGNLSGKNHPDWSLIKTLIYCFCWVFKHFSVQIFFTSYFEKHPSSTITAVHHLYHNNAPKVRDALYIYTPTVIIGITMIIIMKSRRSINYRVRKSVWQTTTQIS